ncbi:MAG: hypothetical protein A3B10_02065 [Candidatus Doudnabacteria bacterium RIFCSPLOWO2_01_FULL_44_21]|uniref:Uncharacterized protein n=1 Tax=Candidatus Doudnabacteria bacterium RIFCSPLOWO2_01_FULL_44_21 TaxID=1817841 RepID=A0A1F5Q596_9BACT|nr:MAG: hypothetical protein A3B95_00175 [Candidatus Doudnabacteria bacterium RIFCSPHIGHO2_02_FULL_43_13b]OGE97361.1 MAG: hypothetical protein A3B10_02065 [Candidatus Doudnabacteria bacterium RIFCSPLOWO2_01_FULL_44_21]
MITEQNFIRYIKKTFADRQMIVVAQKEPYIHTTTEGSIKEIKVEKAIGGGVNTLIDSILRKTGGTMFAVSSGDADHLMVDKEGKISVPPWNPSYTLKRIFLSDAEQKGFYYGVSNQTIWPLFHAVFIKPKFHASWWKQYVAVNRKFADAILEEVKNKKAFVWIHDYQFSLLAKMLKKQRPDLQIGVFWHIPWPTYEIFRINPWRKEMLEGLLASDFIGFHRGYHVENFLKCVRSDLEVIVDYEPRSAVYKNHTTRLASLPAGVDFDRISDKLKTSKKMNPTVVKKKLGIPWKNEKLVISAERVDYTKGILERLKIIDRFLDKYKQFRKNIIFVSIGVPSRTRISEYKSYNSQINHLADRINSKHGTKNWKPVYLVKHGVSREDLFSYYRLADACLVTALDDGMNLVAKEYLICIDSKKGVLLLSKFTGAAKDLKESMLINPFDTEGSSNALYEALTMKPEMKKARNDQMKTILQENNVYKWAIDFLKLALNE